MTQVDTDLRSSRLRLTFQAAPQTAEASPPTLTYLSDVFSSLDILIELSMRFSQTQGPRITWVVETPEGVREQLQEEIATPKVVEIHYNSPLEVVIELTNPIAQVVGWTFAAKYVGATLLDLIGDVSQLRRTTAGNDLKRHAANVLKARLAEEAEPSAAERQSKTRKKLQNNKDRRKADKAALALSILKDAQYEED